MTPTTRLVIVLVRGWTRLYTLGLPEEHRVLRRQEIDSDLWESLNDPEARLLTLTLFVRLIAGIPDDLGWRVDQPRPARPLMFALVFAGVCTLMLMGLIAWAGKATPLPRPEPLAHVRADRRPPPPPPPPPPIPSRAVR